MLQKQFLLNETDLEWLCSLNSGELTPKEFLTDAHLHMVMEGMPTVPLHHAQDCCQEAHAAPLHPLCAH